MNTYHPDIEKVTYFVLHVSYNRPKQEKSPADSRYAMLYVGKGGKRICTNKITATRSKVLNYKYISSHNWVNCLECNNQSLDSQTNGCIFFNGALQPLWYQGALLPSEEQTKNYLRQESEVLSSTLQDSEKIDGNLTDDYDDVMSDNENENDKQTFLKIFDNFLTFCLAMFPLYRNYPGNLI